MPNEFNRTVCSLVNSPEFPYFLFFRMEELYRKRISYKRFPDDYNKEKLEEKENEVKQLLADLGYNDQGQLFGGSKILKNMALIFSKECPEFISDTPWGGWGGLDEGLFFSIEKNPLAIDDIFHGNEKIKEVFAAYFYLCYVGSVYDPSTLDTSLLDKAELLCLNEEWISKARKYSEDIRLIDLELENETEVKETQSNKCFIATASYGTELASEVIFLKRFRDEFLCHYNTGRFFIKYYYRISPYIARIISKSEIVKMFIRNIVLNPIVFIVRYFLEKNNPRR
uniref:CFI-box-CTERM domain-containing protein n=1 Tax=Candidatus Electronema sp. TaxID=2698783 RepID=UPI004056D7FC